MYAKKKFFSLFTALVMIFAMVGVMPEIEVEATCCRKDNFDKSKYTLTGNMAQDVATIAKSQKGRTCDQFGYSGVDYGQWCDEFVADCIENAGADSSIVGHGGKVSDFKRIMVEKGAKEVSSPQTGDLIFFTKGHVEIVTKVVNGIVYCAGGNNGSSPGSCAGERAASYVGTVSCYLRPNYNGSSNPPVQNNDDELGIPYPRPSGSPLLSTGSKGSGVSWLQTALNKANNAGLAVDGDFGSATKQAVINFQSSNGLDADGIAGPATINKLVEVVKGGMVHKPTWAWISVTDDRTSFNVGEQIHFWFSADETHAAVDHYVIGIDKNGERIITEGCKNDYYISFDEPGDYSVYVSATNSNCSWYVNSNVINFTILPLKPTWAQISVTDDRTSFNVGEQIHFWFSADETHAAVDHYVIGIDKNGERIITEGCKNDYYISFDEPGDYSVYVSATNSNCSWYVNSNVINFTITNIKGDLNSDGKSSIADAVKLKSWLTSVPNLKLENKEAADLNSDGKINVFDLCILKRMLIKK